MIFSKVWGEAASGIVGRLKSGNHGHHGNHIQWSSHVVLSRDTSADVAETGGVLEVGGRKVRFDHEGLVRFYTQLERIQSAIDNLG